MNTTPIIISILVSFVLGVIAGYGCYKIIRDDREEREQARKHLKR